MSCRKPNEQRSGTAGFADYSYEGELSGRDAEYTEMTVS